MKAAITALQLLRWGDLEARRRRQAATAGWLPWALIVAAGVGGGALVAVRARDDVSAASDVALLAMLIAHTWMMLATPFRMYWRPDSPLLARLPIPGAALFDVAMIRTLRAAGRAAVVTLPCCAAIAVADVDLAVRHVALWAVVAAGSALLVPAVAFFGGAIIVSGKVHALSKALGGGELQAPPTFWLGGLPGLATASVVLMIFSASRWALGAPDMRVGDPATWSGAIVGTGVVGWLLARRAAPYVMPLAVREVAALDVQRLAHIEIHPPTAIERAVAGRLSTGGALVHGKDARLIRRRFPMALLTGAITTLALWIVALSNPDAAAPWLGAILGGFVGYGVAMARRMITKPIELRFVQTLPVAAADTIAAKRAYVTTWTLLYAVVGAAPVIARAPDRIACAAVAVGAVIASLMITRFVIR